VFFNCNTVNLKFTLCLFANTTATDYHITDKKAYMDAR
jgi:hypothetical protein